MASWPRRKSGGYGGNYGEELIRKGVHTTRPWVGNTIGATHRHEHDDGHGNYEGMRSEQAKMREGFSASETREILGLGVSFSLKSSAPVLEDGDIYGDCDVRSCEIGDSTGAGIARVARKKHRPGHEPTGRRSSPPRLASPTMHVEEGIPHRALWVGLLKDPLRRRVEGAAIAMERGKIKAKAQMIAEYQASRCTDDLEWDTMVLASKGCREDGVAEADHCWRPTSGAPGMEPGLEAGSYTIGPNMTYRSGRYRVRTSTLIRSLNKIRRSMRSTDCGTRINPMILRVPGAWRTDRALP